MLRNMQMSELTYQMKPAFHPENCRQPKEEQTDFSQTELRVVTPVVSMPSSPTDGIHLWLWLQSPSPSLLHVVELLGSC